jgi:hypothetical protein
MKKMRHLLDHVIKHVLVHIKRLKRGTKIPFTPDSRAKRSGGQFATQNLRSVTLTPVFVRVDHS